jgi:hypothetical protein
MIDETTGPGEQNTPEGETTEAGERVAFCQQCGKGLTSATIRRAGSAVYCEPCLVARLEGSGAAGAGQAGSPGQSGTAGATGWTPVGAVPTGGAAGQPVGAPAPNEPSPWLAAFLGLIPGVGAMYNGQYAKGVAHLVIFAVLDSLAHNVHDVFGLLVAGWIFYQVFDAYHTAKARRDGTPLPNPFGLNEVGDRMGFGKNWPGSATRPVTSSTTAGWASAAAGPATAQGPAGGPGWTGYVPPTNFGAAAAPPPPPPLPPTASPGPVSSGSAGSSTAWTQSPYTNTYAGEPWRSPSGVPVPPMPPIPPMPSRRFPVGAAWLIAVGLIFLMANLNGSWRLGGSWAVAIVLAALGVFILFRRVEMVIAWSKVGGDADAHDYGIAPKVLCQIRGPVMLLVLALLFALQAAGFRTLGQTWGVLLIAFGGLMILERTLGRNTWYPVNPPVSVGPSPTAEARKDGQ